MHDSIPDMGLVDDAVQAHRAAQEALSAAQVDARALVATARARVEAARLALAEAIVAETLKGASQIDIIRRTGYARETVRTILRKAGVDADR